MKSNYNLVLSSKLERLDEKTLNALNFGLLVRVEYVPIGDCGPNTITGKILLIITREGEWGSDVRNEPPYGRCQK